MGARKRLTRGERNIQWIQSHCRIPEGRFVGRPVRLTAAQKVWIREIYDTPTRMFILSMARKNAKALAMDTPIPTPDGWKTMAAIHPGDYVFGADGRPVRVLVESEVFVGKRCYRVSFSDGSSVVASEDHVWTTRHRYRPWSGPSTYAGGKVRGSGARVGRDVVGNVTTAQIADSVRVPRPDGGFEANHKISVAPALETAPIDLPIDPYVLGAWLGDGTSACAAFTCSDGGLPHLRAEIERALGCSVTVARYKDRAATVRATGSGLQAKLRECGLLGNKHIPDAYFDAGTAQRWALLQGLMDTDGTVHLCAGGTTPRCSFTGTNEAICRGVWRLARSLGLKATIHQSTATIAGRDCGPKWRVEFPAARSAQVFRLDRKQSRLPEALGKRSGTLTITACEEVASVPTKCIAVDSEDHLFLAGYGCVPTHNTATASFLLLLHLCGPEARPNSQLYSAAQSRDQAAILFALAAKVVRLSPGLSEYVVIRDTAKQLFCPELGTLYRALSAEASTAYGLSPVFTVHDELGQVKGPRSELYEALETASAAQESPLSIVISTQAPTDADLLSLLIDDALTGADPRNKVVLHTAPLDADPFDEETIRLANPHYDVFMNKEEVRRQASDAKRLPSREASYRNLILNQRVEASNPFINRTIWQENGAEPREPGGQRVYGGLDLSSVSDLTALVLVSEEGDVYPTCWLPEEGLAEKSRADRVPYDVWAREGYLETTPGRAIEYEFVACRLREVFDTFDVVALGFDRYNMRFLRPWLERAGFTEEELEKFVEFGQGFVSMSPALRELESRLLARKLRHGNHPVLTMCAANAVAVSDPAGNRKFTKSKASGRIDGMVALAMAVGVMPTETEDEGDFADFIRDPIII